MAYSDELYHHGIKGMHWGIRRYRNKGSSKKHPNKSKKRSKYYKAAAIGAGIIVAGLAVYGGYKLGAKGMASANREISDGKKWVSSAFGNLTRNPLVSEVSATFKGNDLKEHKMSISRSGDDYIVFQDGVRINDAVEDLGAKINSQYQKEFTNVGQYAKAAIKKKLKR